MALTLHVCPGDVGTIVWVSGDVDFNTAGAFQDMLLRVMRRHSPWLLVDMSGVSFMDCAGLRALMRTRRRAELRRGSVRRRTCPVRTACLAVWGMALAPRAGWLGLTWVIPH